MTALFALAPVADLARQDNQDAAHAEGRRLFAVADGLRGHAADMGTTLIAMLFSGGRAALAHQRLPRVQAPQRASSRPDHRGPSDRQSCLGRRLARAGARTALDYRPDRPDDIGVRDLRARPLPAALGLS